MPSVRQRKSESRSRSANKSSGNPREEASLSHHRKEFLWPLCTILMDKGFECKERRILIFSDTISDIL